MLFRIIVPFGWYILGAMEAGGTPSHDINLEIFLFKRNLKIMKIDNLLLIQRELKMKISQLSRFKGKGVNIYKKGKQKIFS